jgi:hypothetical protein
VKVCHGDKRLTGLAQRAGGFNRTPYGSADPIDIGVPAKRDAYVCRTKERDGHDQRRRLPRSALERNDEPLRVELTAAARSTAKNMKAPHSAKQWVEGVEAGGGVVVPSDDHDLKVACVSGTSQEVVPEAHSRRRRVRGVEHIARDEDRIDLSISGGLEQPVDEAAMFVKSLDPVKNVTEMPVAGVEQAQSHGVRFYFRLGHGHGAAWPVGRTLIGVRCLITTN